MGGCLFQSALASPLLHRGARSAAAARAHPLAPPSPSDPPSLRPPHTRRCVAASSWCGTPAAACAASPWPSATAGPTSSVACGAPTCRRGRPWLEGVLGGEGEGGEGEGGRGAAVVGWLPSARKAVPVRRMHPPAWSGVQQPRWAWPACHLSLPVAARRRPCSPPLPRAPAPRALPQAALAARLPERSLALGAPVAAAQATASGAALRLESGQRLECLAVVGADGARSAVAAAAGRAAPNYCGQSAIRCEPPSQQASAPCMRLPSTRPTTALPPPPPRPGGQLHVRSLRARPAPPFHAFTPSPPALPRAPSLLPCCSGVARFPQGIPAELQARCIRQVWGPGARAGTYAISGTAGWAGTHAHVAGGAAPGNALGESLGAAGRGGQLVCPGRWVPWAGRHAGRRARRCWALPTVSTVQPAVPTPPCLQTPSCTGLSASSPPPTSRRRQSQSAGGRRLSALFVAGRGACRRLWRPRQQRT